MKNSKGKNNVTNVYKKKICFLHHVQVEKR